MTIAEIKETLLEEIAYCEKIVDEYKDSYDKYTDTTKQCEMLTCARFAGKLSIARWALNELENCLPMSVRELTLSPIALAEVDR